MTAPRVPGFSLDEELKKKLLFTLLAIFIYRVGAHIASPTVDVVALQAAIQGSAAQGLFALYDALGGGLTQATILALGIMPYISASIVFQLAAGVVPSVSKMQKDEDGRKTITQWTRYLTVAISLAQAYTFSLFVEGLNAVRDPGMVSRLVMVVILTAGAIFVMWLGEQITERGIGNGMSLLITVSILERLWPGTIGLIEFVRTDVISFPKAVFFIAVLLAMVAAVVAMTLAVRRIPIQIPRKVMGRGRIREGQKTFIPVRLITAGVMPIIFAQTVIIVPSTIANFAQNSNLLRGIAGFLLPGSAVYNVLFALLIVVFSYFYTSIIFNSVDLSENLKKQGAFIPGVKPGSATADYIDDVLGRITLPGSIFLALVAIIPLIIATMLNIPQFQFGGTSILIVVGVLLDTLGQIEQHRTLRKYDGFMKAGRVKSRGGRQSRFGM
jgi:preprotein translocase subunit SecY